MKKVSYYSFIITTVTVLVFNDVSLYAQATCSVLMPSISGKYIGDCKKGLAHGNGEAVGEDRYKGEFKNGLPNGEGIYIWKIGNSYEGTFKKGLKEGKGKLTYRKENKKDSVVVGYWENDKYLGKTKNGYEVISKSGTISYITVRYQGTLKNIIEIYGADHLIDLTNNSKYYLYDMQYKNIDYPITIKLKGTLTSNKSDIEFEIYFERPGNWAVTLENK
jgi:hypothetical protein